jgi:hypothetical protein
MSRVLGLFAFLGVAGTIASIQAQNLLVNGNLNSTPGTVYYDGSDPSIADDVPGWILSLGAADGSYVLVSPESDPLAGGVDADMGIGPAGGGMQTAPLLRPAVVPGLSYLASLTSDNYFTPTTTSYFIDWFDIGGSLISSNGGLIGDPSGPGVYAPYTQTFYVTATAPIGSVTAGVRLTSGSPSYAGLAADNFSFSSVPEPSSVALIALGFAIANIVRRRR